MASARNPIQLIKEAKQIAKDHGCFVAEKSGDFLVYRKTHGGNVFVGKRRDPAQLRALVCRLTGFH
jgi:hypothetical protein